MTFGGLILELNPAKVSDFGVRVVTSVITKYKHEDEPLLRGEFYLTTHYRILDDSQVHQILQAQRSATIGDPS